RTHDGLAMILMQRLVSVLVTVAIVAALRRWPPASRLGVRAIGIVFATGIFDTLANVFYVVGVQSGFASIVATGSGVYPIIPALLAITVLGERLAPNQYVGVIVLLAGLVGLGAAGAYLRPPLRLKESAGRRWSSLASCWSAAIGLSVT